MILQTLCEYYAEQVRAGNPDYAPAGMELKRIHFVLVLSPDGSLIDIELPEKKTCVAKSLPRSGKDACLIPNRLWDNVGFVLGHGTTEKQQAAARMQHSSFRKLAEQLHADHPGNRSFAAVASFYARHAQQLQTHPLWDRIVAKPGHNLSFRLSGESLLAAQQPELLRLDNGTAEKAPCLVSGSKTATTGVHPKIYLPGGSPTGTKLISFTSGCGYDSYGKLGGDNAPLSTPMTEAYAAALTGMMQRGSDHHVVVGEVSILFFTLPLTGFCKGFRKLSDPSVKTDRNDLLDQLADYAYGKDANAEFILMVFVPNATRISVRFHLRTTLSKVYDNLLMFYNEVAMLYGNNLTDPPALLTPFFFSAPPGNSSKLPPQLVADYLRAVLAYTRFPTLIQSLLLDRIRQGKGDNLGAMMMMRCYLNRKNAKQHICMSLNKENTNTAYLLGRMFAILERSQELSQPGIAYTLRDAYYTIASVTPSAVFNRLIGLSNAFFRRIPTPGTTIYLKQQLSEITEQIAGDCIPDRLSLDDQSRFALGYFHQRQTYFAKREQDETSS